MRPVLVVADRPTMLEHVIAELRGIYLCEDCGAELRYPKDPQLCGACEAMADERDESSRSQA